MRTETIEITPAMAEEYLKMNRRNRNVSPDLVRRYSIDMRNGAWSLTHQGIAFFEDGSLADGQHRLRAVVAAECTVPMVVTFGLDSSGAADIDQHRQRTTIDAIKIGGLSDWMTKNDVAIVRAMCPWKIFSPHRIAEIGESLKDGIKFVNSAYQCNRRGLTMAPIRVAMIKAYYANADRELLEDFCTVLSGGEMKSPDDISAIRLREWLLCLNGTGAGQILRNEAELKTQRAIKAFLTRERIAKLVLPNAPIYPLPEWVMEK